jgi:hypothetical protein
MTQIDLIRLIPNKNAGARKTIKKRFENQCPVVASVTCLSAA